MRLFAWELRKLAGDGAARAGLFVVAICLVLGMIGFRFGPSAERGTTVREKIALDEPLLPAVYRRGFGYAQLVLGPAAGILIPAILCVVLGGTLAGESERGTLAEALARPTGRRRIVAAKTGAIIWGHEGPTRHVHGHGTCSDIDARHPGAECYSADTDAQKKLAWARLRTAKGEVISKDASWGFGPLVVYWDADPQREILHRGRISDHGGA